MANPYSQPSKFTYEAPNLPWEKYAAVLEKKQQEFDANQAELNSQVGNINFQEGKLTQGLAKQKNEEYSAAMQSIADDYSTHKNPVKLSKDLAKISLQMNNDPVLGIMKKDSALSPAAWQTESQNQDGVFGWKVKDPQTGELRDMNFEEFQKTGQPIEQVYSKFAGSPKFTEEQAYFDSLTPEVRTKLGGIKKQTANGVTIWYSDDTKQQYSTFEDAAGAISPEFKNYLQTSFNRNNTPSSNFYNLKYGNNQEGLNQYANDWVNIISPRQFLQESTDRKTLDKYNSTTDGGGITTTETPPPDYSVMQMDLGLNLEGLQDTDLSEGATDPDFFVNSYNETVDKLIEMQNMGTTESPEYKELLNKVNGLAPYATEVQQILDGYDNDPENIKKWHKFYEEKGWSSELVADLNYYKEIFNNSNGNLIMNYSEEVIQAKDYFTNKYKGKKGFEPNSDLLNDLAKSVLGTSDDQIVLEANRKSVFDKFYELIDQSNNFFDENIKEERQKVAKNALQNVKGFTRFSIPYQQGVTDNIYTNQRGYMADMIKADIIDFGESIYHVKDKEGKISNVELNDKTAKELLSRIVSPTGPNAGLMSVADMSIDISDNATFLSFSINGNIDDKGNIKENKTTNLETTSNTDVTVVKLKLKPLAVAKEIENSEEGPVEKYLKTYEEYTVANAGQTNVTKHSDRHNKNFSKGLLAQIIKQSPISKRVNMKDQFYGENSRAAMTIWGQPNEFLSGKKFISAENSFQKYTTDKLGTVLYYGDDSKNAKAIDLEYMMNEMKDYKFTIPSGKTFEEASNKDSKVNISDEGGLSYFAALLSSVRENDSLKDTNGNSLSEQKRMDFSDNVIRKLQSSGASIADIISEAQNLGVDLNSLNTTPYVFADSEMANSYLYSGGKK